MRTLDIAFDNFTTRGWALNLHTTNRIANGVGFQKTRPMNATLIQILSNQSVVLVRTLRSIPALKEQRVPF